MPRSHQKRNASLCWLCMEARRHFRCERASGSAVRPSTLWLNLLTHVYGDILMRTFYINYRVGLRRYIIRARLPLLSLSLSLCRALCRNHSNGRTLSRRCQLMSVRRTARGRASAERGYSRAAMARASAERASAERAYYYDIAALPWGARLRNPQHDLFMWLRYEQDEGHRWWLFFDFFWD